ncbi:ATP-binding protein [Deinococcus sp. HMF7604]|uniref:ATP-binding protein n=1 Tax=Deinococcus betulae TaxID=2873312 RepID=UPI001CCC9959|nr:ATP-binding protein [Deinococcus betulae]MBZ9752487.1 ATP-binding protein [Deinococcus betulae]
MNDSVDFGHLRFAPDILQRLGEELIPNPEQGLIELVKNSYDADAKRCTVRLQRVKNRGGTIFIEDNGIGMTAEDILNGFFMIGKSRKSPKKKTAGKRLTVGDKGLGRLAALRLGEKVIIRSRPRKEPGIQYTAKIEWHKIDHADAIEDIKIPITRESSTLPHGVEIEIINLRQKMTSEDVERLTRELILLKDPFKASGNFEVVLASKEFKFYQDRVKDSYFDFSNYKLIASVGKDGTGKAAVHDSSGEVLFETLLPIKSSRKYKIPPAQLEMWVWILSNEYFNETTARLQDVRNWLRSVGGVHIYHRGIRVRPYGDPGFDWLDMNLSRARRPEERPSTNNVIGRVVVNDPNLVLDQPTNRIGFVENETFDELRRFAKEVIDWMGKERLRIAEARREASKLSSPNNSSAALNELRQVINSTSAPAEKKGLQNALDSFVKAKEVELDNLQEELQLYRSLATAGTTSAVFAHESSKPLTTIKTSADTLERRSKKFAPDKFETEFKIPIDRIRSLSISLNAYSQFPIFHLMRRKRNIDDLDLVEIWNNIAKLFKPLLEEAKITLHIASTGASPMVRGSIAMLESIATNLITNSIYALTKSNIDSSDRVISISIEDQGGMARVIHSDNGMGIKNVDIEKIWLPGVTTNRQGTGFGLTIVRDSVNDLRGSVAVVANGSLGGAEFYITLPTKKEGKSNDASNTSNT